MSNNGATRVKRLARTQIWLGENIAIITHLDVESRLLPLLRLRVLVERRFFHFSCDECLKNFHFHCLDPPVKKSPKVRGYSWHCANCDPTVRIIYIFILLFFKYVLV